MNPVMAVAEKLATLRRWVSERAGGGAEDYVNKAVADRLKELALGLKEFAVSAKEVATESKP